MRFCNPRVGKAAKLGELCGANMEGLSRWSSEANASDMLRHDLAGPRVGTGLDVNRPEVAVVDVL